MRGRCRPRERLPGRAGPQLFASVRLAAIPTHRHDRVSCGHVWDAVAPWEPVFALRRQGLRMEGHCQRGTHSWHTLGHISSIALYDRQRVSHWHNAAPTADCPQSPGLHLKVCLASIVHQFIWFAEWGDLPIGRIRSCITWKSAELPSGACRTLWHSSESGIMRYLSQTAAFRYLFRYLGPLPSFIKPHMFEGS